MVVILCVSFTMLLATYFGCGSVSLSFFSYVSKIKTALYLGNEMPLELQTLPISGGKTLDNYDVINRIYGKYDLCAYIAL